MVAAPEAMSPLPLPIHPSGVDRIERNILDLFHPSAGNQICDSVLISGQTAAIAHNHWW